jgi:hypothetical protein
MEYAKRRDEMLGNKRRSDFVGDQEILLTPRIAAARALAVPRKDDFPHAISENGFIP